jgi:hypothetical protein
MDYEKKYNEALKWMRELYPGLHGATKEDAEHYFPELAESEDERMRRMLIDRLRSAEELTDELREWILSYLEKQKEQKPAESPNEDVIQKAYKEGVNDGIALVKKQPEDYGLRKKPELVQQPPITYTYNSNASRDERLKAALLALLNSDLLKVKEGGYFTKQDLIEWVERIPTEKPAWNEEDEEMRLEAIRVLVSGCERYRKESGCLPSWHKVIDWLKFLRPQPKRCCKDCAMFLNGKCTKPHWKPSEEQMNHLCAAVDAAIRKHNESVSGYEPARALKSLYEDLKKLM